MDLFFNVESRVGVVSLVIFQPGFPIGKSETWENVSRFTDSVTAFLCCLAVILAGSVFDGVKLEAPDGFSSGGKREF